MAVGQIGALGSSPGLEHHQWYAYFHGAERSCTQSSDIDNSFQVKADGPDTFVPQHRINKIRDIEYRLITDTDGITKWKSLFDIGNGIGDITRLTDQGNASIAHGLNNIAPTPDRRPIELVQNTQAIRADQCQIASHFIQPCL